MSIETNREIVTNRIFSRPNFSASNPEDDRSEELPDVAGRDNDTDLCGCELPFVTSCGIAKAIGEHSVGVEECCNADDHAAVASAGA
jgi:hypothetical protein